MEGIQSGNLIPKYSGKKRPEINSVGFCENSTNSSAVSVSSQNVNKLPIHLWLLSCTMPIVGLVIPRLFSEKLMKSDQALGIKSDEVKKVLDHMFEEHKLTEKGVKYVFVQEESEAAKILEKNCGGAAYLLSKKVTAIPKKFSLILHETGHAINQNCTKLGKVYNNFLSKTIGKLNPEKFFAKTLGLRDPLNLTFYAAIILQLVGNSYTIAKIKGKNPDEKKFSFSKFVHDNIGKLTLLLFAPILLDEGFSTYRAIKATKKVSPEILKSLRKNLFIAGGTYLITAASMLISVLASKNFNDHVYLINQQNKNIKNNNESI